MSKSSSPTSGACDASTVARGRAAAALLRWWPGRRMTRVPVGHTASGAKVMSRVMPCSVMWLAAAMLVLAPPAALARPPSGPADDAIRRLDAARSLTDLSRALWPGWDVSDEPAVLYEPGAECYVLGHSDLPPAFSRVSVRRSAKGAVYRAPTASIDPASGRLAGVPTAFVELGQFSREAVPTLFQEVFRAYQVRRCSSLAEPVDLIAGYPIDPQNLAFVDIECELLNRAVLAPDDSLRERVLEFVCVRSLRRICLTPRVSDYEARLEFLEGVPDYIAECVRRDGRPYARGKVAERLGDAFGTPAFPARSLTTSGGLDWYRRERFAASGAAVCALLDRFHPGWKAEASKQCIEPYALLWELTRREIPKAAAVLARFEVDRRVAEKKDFVESNKSPAERLFDSIAKREGPLLTISTRALTGASVNYDPTHIEKVDAHREVHTRMIKIEYTDGTRVEIEDRPIAVILGDDEFDIDQLVIEAPSECSITVGGEPLEPSQGTHQLTRPVSVTAPGLLIEAQSAILMVGDDRMTFVLRR